MVKRKQSPPRLPLDFTKLVASRRANRVAAYKHMEGNNDHFYNIQHAVAVENDFNERQRVAEKLRLGAVPAHVTHRVVDALVVRAQGIAAANIEADRQAKIKAAAKAAKAAKEAAEEATKEAARVAKVKADKEANRKASADYDAYVALVYIPSQQQQAAQQMTFNNVVKKTLTKDEISARNTMAASREFPDAVKSGNAKLRAIYE